MGHYAITAANEPDPDILAKAWADLYLSYIRKSPNPEKTYELVMLALDMQAQEQHLARNAEGLQKTDIAGNCLHRDNSPLPCIN